MIVTTGVNGARAEVRTHGAQVTSWIPAAGNERLFLSRGTSFDAGAAIRGGIPAIFPQFSTFGPLPKHGFARTEEWKVVDASANVATFRLDDSAQTRAIWPHAFLVELTVMADGNTLDVSLSVNNLGDDAFEFTAALHTYLRTDDVSLVRIRGLDGLQYRDTLAGGIERREEHVDVVIDGAVDRIYLDAVRPVEIHEAGRVMRATMTGFRDVVVWNPGAEGGAALADLEPEGYRRMVCVEAAIVAEPVHLARGAEWNGAQRLDVE
jgi:glucose-6-phosphate 1-epimerase